jgi:hypothetical protein
MRKILVMRTAPAVKALAFDVFGTVVDWRGSIVREGRLLGRKKKIRTDWRASARAICPGRGSTTCTV